MTSAANPNPKYLKPHNGLTATQRKRLALEKSPPRQRLPTEAQPRIHVNASQRESYTGAELRPYTGRPGAMDAYKLPSLGLKGTQ